MKNIELHPCWKCGGEAEASGPLADFGNKKFFAVECTEDDNHCDNAVVGHSRAAVVKEWNSYFCWEEIARLQKQLRVATKS